MNQSELVSASYVKVSVIIILYLKIVVPSITKTWFNLIGSLQALQSRIWNVDSPKTWVFVINYLFPQIKKAIKYLYSR